MANILVVDDKKDILEVVKIILEIDKHAVDTVDNGPQGLTCMRNKKYDLVLLDIMMPQMSGLEVIKEVRKDNSELKVVALTAMAQQEDKDNALQAGFDGYIIKPFTSDVLLAEVKKFL